MWPFVLAPFPAWNVAIVPGGEGDILWPWRQKPYTKSWWSLGPWQYQKALLQNLSAYFQTSKCIRKIIFIWFLCHFWSNTFLTYMVLQNLAWARGAGMIEEQNGNAHSLFFPQCLVLISICSIIFFDIPRVLKFSWAANTLGTGWLIKW